MHHYIKFDFDLGYGYGLPVLIKIDQETKQQLQQYFQKNYSDDDFIMKKLVTLKNKLQSNQFCNHLIHLSELAMNKQLLFS